MQNEDDHPEVDHKRQTGETAKDAESDCEGADALGKRGQRETRPGSKAEWIEELDRMATRPEIFAKP